MSDQKCMVAIISGIVGMAAGALAGLAAGQTLGGMAVGSAVSIVAGIVGAYLYKAGSGKPRVAVGAIPHAGWIGGLAASIQVHGGLVSAFVGCIIGYAAGALIPATIILLLEKTERKHHSNTAHSTNTSINNKSSSTWIYITIIFAFLKISSTYFTREEYTKPPFLRNPETSNAVEGQPYRSLAQSQAAAILTSGAPLTLHEITTLADIMNGRSALPNTNVLPTTTGQTATPLSPPSISAGTLGNISNNGQEPHNAYKGSMGTTYQYDLSDPIQRVRYGVDPVAQLRDSISVDPRRQLDQKMGQYGGGIQQEP